MLSCKEITELVTDYLEGRLGLGQRLSFFLHVSMCRHCRAYIAQMKATTRALGHLPPEPVPAEVADRLRAAFGDFKRRGPKARTPEAPLWARPAWNLVAVVLSALAIALALADAEGDGPLGPGARCLLAQVGLGTVALGAALGVSRWRRAPVATGVLVTASVAGAIVGQLILRAACPMHATPHVLAFHVGAVVIAIGLGLAAGRVAASRTAV